MRRDISNRGIRVNVNWEYVPQPVLKSPARAHIRGDPMQNELPLPLIRLEPYAVPKASMTGVNIERVVTKLIQVI